MSSNLKGEDVLLLNFDRDVPTTAADVEALRQNRPGAMTFEQYLRFLDSIPVIATGDLRRRKGPRGPVFTLF